MNIKGPFVFWLPMVAIGMVNGLFRGLVLIRLFDETTAGQISSITLIILLAVYVGFIYTRLSIRSTSHALMIGTFWAFLTFVFETALGYFGTGLSMGQIMAEYNIFEGKLWSFVLVTLIILPYAFYRFKAS